MMNNRFERHSKSTQRAAFLARLETLMSWAEFWALIHGQEKRFYPLTEADHLATPRKSCVRAKIQHPLLRITHLWELPKVRYRSLAKNTYRAFAMLALHNIVHWGRPLAEEVYMA
jgi:hypothetical protein